MSSLGPSASPSIRQHCIPHPLANAWSRSDVRREAELEGLLHVHAQLLEANPGDLEVWLQ